MIEKLEDGVTYFITGNSAEPVKCPKDHDIVKTVKMENKLEFNPKYGKWEQFDSDFAEDDPVTYYCNDCTEEFCDIWKKNGKWLL